jgi:hypothetical protein
MSSEWESLIEGARELDRGVPVEAVLEELLTRFDMHGASDLPGYAVAELLRALLAAWGDDGRQEDELSAVGEGDDEA